MLKHGPGWVPQFGVLGDWLLIWSVVNQHLPCFAHAAQGCPIEPKPSDPISDPILDPDSFPRFYPHHSTPRNRIQNWISKSDPKLDPSIRLWDAKSDAKLDTQWGLLGLCIVGCTTGHPAGPGRHLFKEIIIMDYYLLVISVYY